MIRALAERTRTAWNRPLRRFVEDLAAPCSARASSTSGHSAHAHTTLASGTTTADPDSASFDWNLSKTAFAPVYPYALQHSAITIDGPAPNFSGDAVIDGEITELKTADYKGKWVVLFFYPKDFTFVCPTEIIAFSDRAHEFEERNCAVIGASCDSAEVHLAWIRTPRKKGGLGHMQIPLLADVDRRIASLYGVLTPDLYPNRGVYLIDPQGQLKSMQINMNDVGRSVDEALRLVDAFQYVSQHGVVCPANWKPGAATMLPDPDGSLKYFSSAESSQEEGVFGETLTPVTSPEQFKEIVSGGKPAVIDFMATWCGKCRMIAPTVEALQAEHPQISFYKFDTNSAALEQLADELGVTALPAFKFYAGGKEVGEEVIGYKKKPLEQAVSALAKLA